MGARFIDLEWNQFGTISHSSNLNSNDEKLYLGFSLPYFISHLLGSSKVSYGLIIVDQIFNYFIDNNHKNLVINNAIKSARLEFSFSNEMETIMKYKPRKKYLSNSDSLEEGSRQLLNNYLAYVVPKYSETNRLTLMTLCGAVIMRYDKLLSNLFSSYNLHKTKLWHPELSILMIQHAMKLSNFYSLDWWDNETEDKINKAKSNTLLSMKEIKEKFKLHEAMLI